MRTKLKNTTFPDTVVLLFMVMILMAVLTWITDGGRYGYERKAGKDNV